MDLDALAEQLKSGAITIEEWKAQMVIYLREQYRTAMLLVKGEKSVTFADWGYEGSMLKKQYAYLRNFANEIKENPQAWNNGRLNQRMALYKESAYTALEELNRREHKLEGFDEERRVLGDADHCNGCIAQAAMDWQPTGTLDQIGDEECITNCKCSFEYRKSGETP
jgi:hypothetical protein